MTLLLTLVLCHLVADLVLQPSRRFGAGEPGRIRVLYHGLVTLTVMTWGLVMVVWLGYVNLTFQGIAVIAALVTVAHLLVHGAVKKARSSPGWEISSIAWFTGDQVLHLVALAAISSLFAGAGVEAVPAMTGGGQQALAGIDRWLLSGIVLLSGTVGAGYFLRNLLEPYAAPIAAEGVRLAGFWIGFWERLLLMVVIAAGSDAMPSMAVVLAVKSIYRFEALKQRTNAEYYLLGTLASVTLAVILGLVLGYVHPWR